MSLFTGAPPSPHELAYQDGLTDRPNRQFDEALREAIGSPPRADAAHGVFLRFEPLQADNDVHAMPWAMRS